MNTKIVELEKHTELWFVLAIKEAARATTVLSVIADGIGVDERKRRVWVVDGERVAVAQDGLTGGGGAGTRMHSCKTRSQLLYGMLTLTVYS